MSGVHQFLLRSNIVENKQQHEFQNNRRRDRNIADVDVAIFHFEISEIKINKFITFLSGWLLLILFSMLMPKWNNCFEYVAGLKS